MLSDRWSLSSAEKMRNMRISSSSGWSGDESVSGHVNLLLDRQSVFPPCRWRKHRKQLKSEVPTRHLRRTPAKQIQLLFLQTPPHQRPSWICVIYTASPPSLYRPVTTQHLSTSTLIGTKSAPVFGDNRDTDPLPAALTSSSAVAHTTRPLACSIYAERGGYLHWNPTPHLLPIAAGWWSAHLVQIHFALFCGPVDPSCAADSGTSSPPGDTCDDSYQQRPPGKIQKLHFI